MDKFGFSYLAAPYSDPDLSVIERRMREFCIADAFLMQDGFRTVSPLSKHYTRYASCNNIPGDWEYWKAYSTDMMAICDRLIIIDMNGWKASAGVSGEIDLAIANRIPIYLYNGLKKTMKLISPGT